MLFTISGQGFSIRRQEVVDAAKGVTPDDRDGRHKYYIQIDGRRYPIKQLLHLVTGLRRGQFTAQYATRILTRLGFDVEQFVPSRPWLYSRSTPPQTGLTEGPLRAVEQPDDRTYPPTQVGRFAVTLERDEDGWVVASCPVLPGCHSQGRSRQEAVNNVREAIRGYLASMEKHGETLPDQDWEVVEVTA
jgi:predicted RNase H-like HicB family nuclease